MGFPDRLFGRKGGKAETPGATAGGPPSRQRGGAAGGDAGLASGRPGLRRPVYEMMFG